MGGETMRSSTQFSGDILLCIFFLSQQKKKIIGGAKKKNPFFLLVTGGTGFSFERKKKFQKLPPPILCVWMIKLFFVRIKIHFQRSLCPFFFFFYRRNIRFCQKKGEFFFKKKKCNGNSVIHEISFECIIVKF